MAVSSSRDVKALSQLDGRDVNALTEPMNVNPDEPHLSDEQIAVYNSHEEDGMMVCERYVVDPSVGICDCPDMLHRRPTDGCKHLRRVWFLEGDLEIPAGINYDALDDEVRKHIDDGVCR